MKPVIAGLGGVTGANDSYFAWQGRSADVPDYRDFFRVQAMGRRRIGEEQTYRLGQFLWTKWNWCSPLALLYANSHFEAYTAVLNALVEEIGCNEPLGSILQYMGVATESFDLDTWSFPYVWVLAERAMEADSFGAHFLDVAACESNFEETWSSLAKRSGVSEELRRNFERRHIARLACSVDGALLAKMDDAFGRWLRGGRKRPDQRHFLLAYEIGGIKHLEPQYKRIAVDDFLLHYFDRATTTEQLAAPDGHLK